MATSRGHSQIGQAFRDGGLMRCFKRHFAELVVESAKLFTMSRKEVDAGMIHHGTELMESLHAQGKHVLIVGGHMGNWEWSALTLSQNLRFRTMALYKKLSNPKAEKRMKESRAGLAWR